MNVHRDIDIGGQRFALLVETEHDGVVARTAVHRQDFRRRIGGARFVRHGDVQEVAHLAAGMTWKCAAAGLPADGQKSVLACGDALPPTVDEKAAILAEHVRLVKSVDPGVIFGPDMNNGEDVMNRVSEQDDLRDHITGLSGTHGGLSIDRRGYTAYGLVASVDAAMRITGRRYRSATVQGFGAVGAHAAIGLAKLGIALKGASVYGAALLSDGDAVLPVEELFAAWEYDADAGFRRIAEQAGPELEFRLDHDDVLSVRADVFVPAARTSVLACRDELERVRAQENPACQSIEDFLDATGVSVIAQGANHPLSEAAEAYAQERGVILLPDYIVNCGGLIGCYFEWAFRDELLASAERRDALHERALRVIDGAIERNVRELLARSGSVRDNAEGLAQDLRGRLLVRQAALGEGKTSHEIAQTLLSEL